jgi:allantoate deiminase
LQPVKTPLVQLAEDVICRCRRLATFSEDSGSLRRTFLSPPMHDVHREIAHWLAALGAIIRIDAVGNFRATYAANGTSAPRLLIGSHLDTVPDAGSFDGILGVVLAVAILQALEGRRLRYAIEIVGFSEEEGVRFGVPFIGSRALVDRLDNDLLNRQDARGISVRKAIQDFGLDPHQMGDAVLPADACAYLEYHLEQGPVLESLGLPLAVVEAIAGQTRSQFAFLGRANHAGTTPMHLRFDAVAAAAEWITRVERIAQQTPGLVATVGSVETKPGATNVIAGEARVSLDVRHHDNAVRVQAAEQISLEAAQIANRRGLHVSQTPGLNQPSVAMDPVLRDQLEESIRKVGCKPHRMVSGAGHDAMILAEKIPSAMIFLRTPGGTSHHPAESVAVEDVAKAIECGLHFLDQMASSRNFLSRTCRA